MKMNNKILIIILIVIIAVLAIGSFSFAKVESVSGGNCTINSYVGEYTELNYDAVANPGATVKEIVNSPNESVVDIYKYHVSLGSVVKDNNRLTKKDDLSLRPDQSYLIEGAHEGVIDIDYESLDNGTSLIKTAHNIKINVNKINISYNIKIPDSKLNPNENTQSIPVNVTGDYYQVGMNTNPLINDLSVYLEFKYNDNGVIKTIKSNSFSASSITKEKSSYNIKTPRLIGDTDYNVSVKPASGNSDDKYNILNPNIYNTTTKIRTKLQLISGTGNANHNIGYDKDVPFKHVVTYKLTNADNGKPLVSQPVNILGKNQIKHIPLKRVFDRKTGQFIIEPAHEEITPYYLNSTNDGIITVTYSTYGDFSLKTEYNGDNDSLPTNSGGSYLIIKKIVGEGKEVIIHSAGSGGAGDLASHWTTDNNGFDFSADPNWILAFRAETKIWFYDIDGNQIGDEEHHNLESGEGNKHILIPANAATMDIECGIKDGGVHTTKKGIEAGKAAINYDALAGGSTRNCHVITDTWDSGYIKLNNGFNNNGFNN